MEKFRLILHGALNGSAEGRAELIERLETGLGLSRETAEMLMSDLPRIIRDDLTEAEASDLSFELEALGALVETEGCEPADTEVEEESPGEMSSFDDDFQNDATPEFHLDSFESPKEAISEAAIDAFCLAENHSSETSETIESIQLEDSIIEIEAPPIKKPTVAQSVHANLSSLDLGEAENEDELEIGFDTEESENQTLNRTVGFFDDPIPSPPIATTSLPTSPPTAPAPHDAHQVDDAVAAFKAIPAAPRVAESSPPATVTPIPKQGHKAMPFVIGSAILGIVAFGGFYAFNQPPAEPKITVSGNIGALLKDQEKILNDEEAIKIPTVRTLRSWSRDFVQEKYSGRLAVDELPDGKARVRLKLTFLMPERPSKEDLALGRGRSEWMTSAEGELESKPETEGVMVHLPIQGDLRAYLQGINTTSRKPVDVTGAVNVDSKASNITAKLEFKIRLKNLSPAAKTTQEPYSDHTLTLEIK